MRCPISCLTTSLGGVLGGPPRQPKRQNLKKTNGFSTISLKSLRFARDILEKVQSLERRWNPVGTLLDAPGGMLKMSVSPETSSENEDVENAHLIF